MQEADRQLELAHERIGREVVGEEAAYQRPPTRQHANDQRPREGTRDDTQADVRRLQDEGTHGPAPLLLLVGEPRGDASSERVAPEHNARRSDTCDRRGRLGRAQVRGVQGRAPGGL